MKPSGLVLATVFTLLLTGIVLSQTSWRNPPSPSLHDHARARDPFAGEAAWRWRHCQPTHWRACLLQR